MNKVGHQRAAEVPYPMEPVFRHLKVQRFEHSVVAAGVTLPVKVIADITSPGLSPASHCQCCRGVTLPVLSPSSRRQWRRRRRHFVSDDAAGVTSPVSSPASRRQCRRRGRQYIRRGHYVTSVFTGVKFNVTAESHMGLNPDPLDMVYPDTSKMSSQVLHLNQKKNSDHPWDWTRAPQWWEVHNTVHYTTDDHLEVMKITRKHIRMLVSS